ncbi:MAG: sugar ABC transporter permease [Bifidobacteriaceae bacterium]|nr:sugar ABC transporter permease [Bifidobacteriaceae bacterium]
MRASLLFLSPALLALAIFSVWPMIRALYLSFTEYNIIRPPRWTGLDNYRQMIADSQLHNAVVNTLVYAAVGTVGVVVMSMGLAAILNTKFPLRSLVRTAVFLPYITSLSIVAIAWSFLLNPEIGLLSHWLNEVGFGTGQGVLRSPQLAMPAVIAVGIWKNLGFYTVIYLAGLQSIPRELYEAASVDGAGPIRRFFKLTVPLLNNQTLLVAVMATITNVQVFDQVYVMTQGGPFFKTDTIVNLIYRSGFTKLDFGYASAISWLLVAILGVLAAVQMIYFRRRAVRY